MSKQRIREILFNDRKMGLLAASALRVISNVAVLLWVVLTAIAFHNNAREGQLLVAIMAIPVLLLWLLGRYAHGLVDRDQGLSKDALSRGALVQIDASHNSRCTASGVSSIDARD
jgi:hypothetical protein